MENDKKGTKKFFSEFSRSNKDDWYKLILNDLGKQDYEKKLIWQLPDGIRVNPFYCLEDIADKGYMKSVRFSKYATPDNQIKNAWKICQEINVDKINTANELALKLINHGAGSITFNMKQVPSVPELYELLKGINPENISINFAKCYSFNDLAESYFQYLKESNFSFDKATGSMDVDPFANLLTDGDYPDNFESVNSRLLSLQTAVIKYLPLFRSINIRGHIYHNAGATAAQELGFSLAEATEYISILSENIPDIAVLLKRFQFTFAVGSNYFVEIAKLRAARLLWSFIVSKYNPAGDNNGNIIINSVTSYWNKSIIDPYTNMLRLTTEAMSAVTGGCDSLTVLPFDFLQKKQNEFSLIHAIHIQNLIKEESGFDHVVDPSAGSFYIENLTELIAEKAWEYFRLIEKNGGFVESVKKGIVQAEINNVTEIKNNEIKSAKEKILGVNIFPDIHEKVLKEVETDLSSYPLPGGKLVKPLILQRKAMIFEKLRLKTEKFINNGGKPPKVFLFPVGDPAMSSARSMFSRNFFGCSGFSIVENNHFKDADSGIEAMVAEKPEITIVCSSDNEYMEWTAKIICKMKNKGINSIIIVAGYPVEIINNLTAQGVNDFIHIKSDITEVISKYQSFFGIN